MITIKLHNVIANEASSWYWWWNGQDGVFSLEFVQRIFAEHPEEKDFKFQIHCAGGEVNEGFAIYDFLRTSGKNIFMNIEGDCHSMAIVLLLAAPLENRSANPNCHALIHKVLSGVYEGTADELQAAADETRQMQDQILDIYADRTGKPREELAAIMNEQTQHSAKELLEWGFISRINSYNTNYKQSKTNSAMTAEQLKEEGKKLLNKFTALLNGGQNVPAAVNYDFVGEDGTVLFSTESEDDTLEVGMPASPDGTFVIADGRTIVIEDGKITEIKEKEDDGEGDESIEDLKKQIEDLKKENEELRASLTEATNYITEASKQIQSNYVPQGRLSGGKKKENSSSDRKAAIRENLKK